MTYPPSPPPLPPPVDPFQPPLSDPTAGIEPVTAIPASPSPSAYRPGIAAAPQPHAQPADDEYYYPPTTEWPAYPAPGPRQRGPLLAVAVVVVLAALLCGGGLVSALMLRDETGSPSGSSSKRPAPAAKRPKPTTPDSNVATVVYEVTGDGPVDITYLRDVSKVITDPGNTGEAAHDVKLPWRITLKVNRPTLMLSVLASRVGLKEGTLTCRILIDGKEIERKTSTGLVTAAACVKIL